MFGYPSQKTFKHMIRNIKNCSVTIEDVRNSKPIYCYNVPTLKGKTACQQPKRVQAEYIEVPDSLRERIRKLTVAADDIFVNRIQFMVSVFNGVNFTMVGYVSRRLKAVLANSIQKIFSYIKITGIL